MTEPRQAGAARTSRPRHPERPCLNCGDTTYGEYCPSCGQHKVDVQVSVRAMLEDLLEDEFLLGKRLPHTLGGLLFRPGFLTAEVLRGRIVRYVRPFKLYLSSSVVFFLVLSFVSLRALEDASINMGGDAAGEASDSIAAAGESLATVEELDSLIAELDARLESGDIGAVQAIGLATARETMARRREALARGDSVAIQGPREETDGDSERVLGIRIDDIDTGSERLDSVLVARARRFQGMDGGEVFREIARTFFAYVPTLMFVLLPVFAAVLKLLYLRQRRFYAEHLVFLLHTHAFVFVVFTLMLLARQWIGGWTFALLLLWVTAYIYLAMRRVYGQRRVVTLVKYWTLGWMYFWILSFGIVALFLASALLLPA